MYVLSGCSPFAILSKGAAIWAKPSKLSTGWCNGGNQPITMADFNGDGAVDVAFLAYYETITVGLGDGSGGFVFTSYPQTVSSTSIASADFDGDGNIDLTDGAHVWYGDGKGTFGGLPTLVAGAAGDWFGAGDITGDGLADVVQVSGGLSPGLSAFISQPGRMFIGMGIVGDTPTSADWPLARVTDINHDGIADFVQVSGIQLEQLLMNVAGYGGW